MCDEKRSTRRLSAAGLALEWKETVKKLFDKVKIVARAPSESPTTSGEGQSVPVRDSMSDLGCSRHLTLMICGCDHLPDDISCSVGLAFA